MVEPIEFLSNAQRKYIAYYCEVLERALESAKEGQVVIDMDAVSDAIGESVKPDFYVSEEIQQLQFNCSSCGSFNDVIGRYCYCSTCGSRHDLELFT